MIENLPKFIPGLQLCEYFYCEAVRPILKKYFPNLLHSAARLDYGSDVLGFDTPQSRDHGWGPKVMIFLSPVDYNAHRDEISKTMANHLPTEIRGYPTNFDAPFSGEGIMQPIEDGPVNHWVATETIADFFKRYLGIDPTQPIQVLDWLAISQQHLRTVLSGNIFHDDLNQLTKLQELLRWYPDDVWLYLLANQWRRIDQEEPLMARCGDVGDELGSRLVASRQIIEIMKLCFLMEKHYAPYYKWFGTAFSRLDCAVKLSPIFEQIYNSKNWKTREKHFSNAYLILAEIHNRLEITPKLEPLISNFHNRPYLVPHSKRFVNALYAEMQSKEVKDLPQHIGALDQFVDSTDILSNPELGKKIAAIFK